MSTSGFFFAGIVIGRTRRSRGGVFDVLCFRHAATFFLWVVCPIAIGIAVVAFAFTDTRLAELKGKFTYSS